MRKAFVLLSGGMDSTTCLYQAIQDYADKENDHVRAALRGEAPVDWVEAVSIYYGQRHKKEMDYARGTCEALGIKHTILDVGALLRGDSVMLTDDSRGKVEVPDIDYAHIKGVSPTYVPFRNGLMLSALTAHAQKWVDAANKIEQEKDKEVARLLDGDIVDLRDWTGSNANVSAGIYFGAHSEDAHNWAYPDCTPEFIGAMANAIFIGSYMQIRLHTPIQWLDKAGVVALGTKLGVSWANTWSCYKGEDKQCGTCPTCQSRKEAFKINGIEDPTEYAGA